MVCQLAADTAFTYKVIGNRKDANYTDATGRQRTSKFQDIRFPEAPQARPFKVNEAAQAPAVQLGREE